MKPISRSRVIRVRCSFLIREEKGIFPVSRRDLLTNDLVTRLPLWRVSKSWHGCELLITVNNLLRFRTWSPSNFGRKWYTLQPRTISDERALVNRVRRRRAAITESLTAGFVQILSCILLLTITNGRADYTPGNTSVRKAFENIGIAVRNIVSWLLEINKLSISIQFASTRDISMCLNRFATGSGYVLGN